MTNNEELLREINNLNSLTDQWKFRELREKVLRLNTNDNSNQPIFEAAKLKGLI